jgi:hypothetical protein
MFSSEEPSLASLEFASWRTPAILDLRNPPTPPGSGVSLCHLLYREEKRELIDGVAYDAG